MKKINKSSGESSMRSEASQPHHELINKKEDIGNSTVKVRVKNISQIQIKNQTKSYNA